MSGNTFDSTEAPWRPLYLVGAFSAVVMLLIIPLQTAVFFVAPPPQDASGFFELYGRSKLLGLVSLDLLYMVDIVLAGVLLLSLCVALRNASPAIVALALFINTAAMAIYFPSNTAFEMLELSGHYANATTDAQRSQLLGAGAAMLAVYEGGAYTVSYVLAAVAGLLLAVIMLRSGLFGRTTAILGVVMNALGLIPPNTGTVGYVAALLFLLPFVVWLVLVARRLFRLAAEAKGPSTLQRPTGAAHGASSSRAPMRLPNETHA